MRKIISTILFAIIALFGFNASAQFDQGDKVLNIGLGLGPGIGAGASLEVGVTDFIGVGGEVNYQTWGVQSINFLTVGARGAYHFGKHFIERDDVDLYGGLSLGYRNVNFSGLGLGYFGSGVYYGIHLGTRYYFKDKMAVFGELGSAAYLKGGIALKF